ncbi:unnamed protein product [Euphydryas editha]|uniref:Protein Wnt n=1 Tax=Euphydryas editha TaxID=104508 RepID=A0AAU9TFS5_EUPED|nr:unnamed protein product [Euphydryas editha]
MFAFKILSVLLGLQIVMALDFDDLYEDSDIEYYEDYYESTADENDNESSNRAKRYQEKAFAVKTLSPEEIQDVRGALQQLLPNVGNENPFTPYSTELTKTLEETNSSTTYSYTYLTTLNATITDNEITTYPANAFARLTTEDHFKIATKQTKRKPYPKRTRHNFKVKAKNNHALKLKQLNNILRQPTTTNAATLNGTENVNATNVTTTTTIRTRSRELDIPRLMAIIADLASEFETNLTRKLNETLFNMSIPTCTTPTTEPPVTDEYDANYTGATIAKCFVCGLDVPRVPQHAHCADAFAGDFLPLVPVDPSAKGRISTFRKYCKYSKIRGYRTNHTHPRNIYGRWTGGCAVRWIDLSGIYTQRTCRNRLQPTMGKHFASKRMAKLERSLWNVENGCIISPMATLVPLSRGISLYARFHACVCTGNWCNTAIVGQQWTLSCLILFVICLAYIQVQNNYINVVKINLQSHMRCSVHRKPKMDVHSP